MSKKIIEVNKETKEINVNIKKGYVVFAIFTFIAFAILAILNYIDFGINKEYFVECINGSKELFVLNNYNYCGEELSIETYNKFAEAVKQ